MRPRSLLFPALAAVLLAVGCAGREAQKVAEPAARPVVSAQAAPKESASSAGNAWPSRRSVQLTHDFDDIGGVAVSAGGALVAVADHESAAAGCFGFTNVEVTVHTAAEGDEIASLRLHDFSLDEMAFTPSGETLAIVARRGVGGLGGPAAILAFLDPRTGASHAFDIEPPSGFGGFRLSVANTAVAVGVFRDGKVFLRRLPSGDPLATFSDPSFTAMALSEDGSTLALGTKDGRIRLRGLPDGHVVRELASLSGAPKSLRFQGDRLISEVEGGQIWGLPVSGAPPVRLGQVRPDARFVGIASDGHIVDVLQKEDVTTVTQDARTFTVPPSRRPWAETVAALSPEGDRVVVAHDTHVFLRRPGDLTADGLTLGLHLRGGALGAGPLADGAVLLGAVWDDGTARMWNVRTGQPIVLKNGPLPPLSSLAIHAKGAVATVGKDGAAIVWERQGTTLKPRHSLRTNGPASAVGFDASGDRILVGTRRGEVVIVDGSTGKTRRVVRTGGKAVSAILAQDETTAQIAVDRDHVLVLDLDTGKLKSFGEAGLIGLLGGDPNAPVEPWESAKRRLLLECWDAVCRLDVEDPSRDGDPIRPVASFGVLDRPGAAFVMADGIVDTLGTTSADFFTCREDGKTYPLAHCPDAIAAPGLLGRVLDRAARDQGAAFWPR
ncbi:WD40 repeat domain-containing protein [Polyangium sp. 15x6]|uniref:WD40 repeat domain-containing protein n=1 Tax=Polyangium sp. 15x6 TaxID=3042687 RepID=UPI00249A04EF|nr:WD40 repeat domain-containing protein [Polyangium sp. 15x6]MDI3281826.1 WD40 repeat domain-containing protein [Polyangium sp. 15x6]